MVSKSALQVIVTTYEYSTKQTKFTTLCNTNTEILMPQNWLQLASILSAYIFGGTGSFSYVIFILLQNRFDDGPIVFF